MHYGEIGVGTNPHAGQIVARAGLERLGIDIGLPLTPVTPEMLVSRDAVIKRVASLYPDMEPGALGEVYVPSTTKIKVGRVENIDTDRLRRRLS